MLPPVRLALTTGAAQSASPALSTPAPIIDNAARDLVVTVAAVRTSALRDGSPSSHPELSQPRPLSIKALIAGDSPGARAIMWACRRAAGPPRTLTLHDYAARSAAWALTGATGQPLAEQIHAAPLQHPAGLTRSQISDTLKHNQPAGHLDHALRALQTTGRATVTQIATGGRPAQLWTATPAP